MSDRSSVRRRVWLTKWNLGISIVMIGGMMLGAGWIIRNALLAPLAHAKAHTPVDVPTASANPLQPVTRSQSSNGESHQEMTEVMAVVNSEPITREELAHECVRRYGSSVADQLIARQLLRSEFQRRGITVTDQEVQAEITRKAKKLNMSADVWLDFMLRQHQVRPEEIYERTWRQYSLRKMVQDDVQVTQEEVQRMLEAEFGPRVLVRMITTESRAKADQVLAMAQAEPDRFGKLAMDHSTDKNSAAKRGLIDPIRRHLVDPTMEKVAFSLREGQVSQVFEISGQFFILQCTRHFPPLQPLPHQLQQAEQAIIKRLSEERIAEAARVLSAQLQKQAQVVKVLNDRQLQQQYPGVAAIVSGIRITIHELAEECIARHGVDVLEGEVNRRILLQQLKHRNANVTQEEIQAEIRTEIELSADAKNYLQPDGSPDIEAWLAHVVSEAGISVDLYVQDLIWPKVALKNLVVQDVQINDEDLAKGFEAHYGERVKVLAIVVQHERQAHKLWKMVKENPSSEFFGQLANKYSTEPASRATFGKVPPIQRYGGQPRLEEEAFRLAEGEISSIIPEGGTWMIVKCLGRTKPVVSDFGAVKDELKEYLFERKLLRQMKRTFRKIRIDAQIDNYLTGSTQSGRNAAGTTPPTSNLGGRFPFRRLMD